MSFLWFNYIRNFGKSQIFELGILIPLVEFLISWGFVFRPVFLILGCLSFSQKPRPTGQKLTGEPLLLVGSIIIPLK